MRIFEYFSSKFTSDMKLKQCINKVFDIIYILLFVIIVSVLIVNKISYYKNLKNSIRVEKALDAAYAGRWYYDISKDVLIWDDNMFKLFGKSKDNWTPTLRGFTDTLHSDDKQRIIDLMYNVMKNKSNYYARYKIIGDDEKVRNIIAFGSVNGNEFAGICLPKVEDIYPVDQNQ